MFLPSKNQWNFRNISLGANWGVVVRILSWGRSSASRAVTTLNLELTLEDRVIRSQRNQFKENDQIIREFQPFIARVTSRFFKRYIDPTSHDAFSIALMAFDESIHAFNLDAGRSFLKFSETVIRRRLTDFLRRESKFRDQVVWSAFEVENEDQDGGTFHPVEVKVAEEEHQLKNENDNRRNEIEHFDQSLQKFGFGFADLAEIAPKHEDTRKTLWRIASIMVNDETIRKRWVGTTRIPLQDLAEKCGMSIKMLEKHRKTLIAYALLSIGDFPFLQEYMKQAITKGGEEK